MYDRRHNRSNGTRYVNCIGGVIVNDGTAQFSVRTVCAKEYVDALNTTVNELKENHIFRFETFDKAQISRPVDGGYIIVYSPVPQGYERMAVVTSCSGVSTSFMYGAVNDADRISENLILWMVNVFDTNTANTIWNALEQLGVFTIFVKKG